MLKGTENLNSKWIDHVKNILCNAGRNDLWLNQTRIASSSLKHIIKQILLDQFLQEWHQSTGNSTKGLMYRSIKEDIHFEEYLNILPKRLSINMIRFRTANHRLPVETGRWYNISIDDRKCNLCSTNSLGDEFHYLLECTFFTHQRRKYIDKRFYRRPNMMLYQSLITSKNAQYLKNLGIFMGIIMNQFNTR